MSKTAPLKDGSVTEQMNVPRMRRRKARTGMTIVYSGDGSGSGLGVSAGTVYAEYVASGSQDLSLPVYSWWNKVLSLGTAVVASTDVTVTAPWAWTAPDQRRVRVILSTAMTLPWGVADGSVAVKVNGIDAAVCFMPVDGRYEIDAVIHVQAGDSVTVEVRARNDEAVEKVVTVSSCSMRLEAP